MPEEEEQTEQEKLMEDVRQILSETSFEECYAITKLLNKEYWDDWQNEEEYIDDDEEPEEEEPKPAPKKENQQRKTVIKRPKLSVEEEGENVSEE